MKTWVIFMITGRGLNPEEISHQLKIKPDKLKQNSFTGEISWQIQSSLEGNQNIVEHLEEILKRIYPVRKIIQGYSRKYQTSFILLLLFHQNIYPL